MFPLIWETLNPQLPLTFKICSAKPHKPSRRTAGAVPLQGGLQLKPETLGFRVYGFRVEGWGWGFRV